MLLRRPLHRHLLADLAAAILRVREPAAGDGVDELQRLPQAAHGRGVAGVVDALRELDQVDGDLVRGLASRGEVERVERLPVAALLGLLGELPGPVRRQEVERVDQVVAVRVVVPRHRLLLRRLLHQMGETDRGGRLHERAGDVAHELCGDEPGHRAALVRGALGQGLGHEPYGPEHSGVRVLSQLLGHRLGGVLAGLGDERLPGLR
ncbi:hypothetical protein [Microbispora sp. H10670]|uniref:hypothetical protein n=1 Tax=Microbispora sp. H10670 TaxID=2729108 RepID=UPI001602C619|nr:hypothetical protein [Microbispora sp. H10670]